MYEALYAENKGLLHKIARRYAGACAFDRAVDVDDLAQAGFFGLVKAQKTFDTGAGKSWAAWAAWYIHHEIQNTLGFRDGKPTRAHSGAVSLNVPLGEDSDGATELDNLTDDSLQDAQEGVELAEERQAVRDAVAALEDELTRNAVRLWGLGGLTKKQTAEALNVSENVCVSAVARGMKQLRRDERLRRALADIDERTRFHAHKGVMAFSQDWTSVTEAAALWRIEAREAAEDALGKAANNEDCTEEE